MPGPHSNDVNRSIDQGLPNPAPLTVPVSKRGIQTWRLKVAQQTHSQPWTNGANLQCGFDILEYNTAPATGLTIGSITSGGNVFPFSTFTVLKPGYYEFICKFQMLNNVSGTAIALAMFVNVNGTAVSDEVHQEFAATTFSTTTVACADELKLNAGDVLTFSVQMFNSTGTAQNSNNNPNGSSLLLKYNGNK